jgi:PmbA protein
MGDGLYLTEVSGLHAGANPVSGDFSLLSRGFEVKGGKCVRAVEQFTVAGNFYKLLETIEAVGNDLLFEGSPIGSPCVRVKNLSVAGEN